MQRKDEPRSEARYELHGYEALSSSLAIYGASQPLIEVSTSGWSRGHGNLRSKVTNQFLKATLCNISSTVVSVI